MKWFKGRNGNGKLYIIIWFYKCFGNFVDSYLKNIVVLFVLKFI